MEKKFTALRIIGTIYKILGVLIALGTVLAVFAVIVGGAASSTAFGQYGLGNSAIWIVLSVIATVIGGAFGALSMYALGEGLFLLINLEENTRFSAMVLRDRLYPPVQPSQPTMPPRPTYPPAPPLPTQQPPAV